MTRNNGTDNGKRNRFALPCLREWQQGSQALYSSLPSARSLDQAEIGCEEIVLGQLAERRPTHVVEDAIFEHAAELIDEEELQVDRAAVAVAMPHARNLPADGER